MFNISVTNIYYPKKKRKKEEKLVVTPNSKYTYEIRLTTNIYTK